MDTQTVLGFFVPGAGELLFIGLGLALTAFWIWMLVDCALRISSGDRKQIGWLIAIALTHAFGALVYFFLGRRARLATRS